MEIGVPLTLVMRGEDGDTYEVKCVVLEVSEEIRRVKVQSGQEVSWLPLDEIVEVKNEPGQ